VLALVLAAALALPCGAPSVSAAARPGVHAMGEMLLGVYHGNQGWQMTQVQAMEHWQGKQHAVVHVFTNWCGDSPTTDGFFDRQLPSVWANGNVPLISWEPYLCSRAGTPVDVERRAASGDYDAYLTGWADRLQTFLSGPDGRYGTADDRRAFLRVGHEMNDDWYPWGAAMGNNAPEDFVAMWHRLRAIFDARGLDPTRLQWMWAVNNIDAGGVPAERYFPGDAAVDWVAVDGYNWGGYQPSSAWQPPSAVFGDIITRLRAMTAKPLAITEAGSTTAANAAGTDGGAGATAKSRWVIDLFGYARAQDVRLISWFNEDQRPDWAVFGGAGGDETFLHAGTEYSAYSAYRHAVTAARVAGPDMANPRLISDARFAGR